MLYVELNGENVPLSIKDFKGSFRAFIPSKGACTYDVCAGRGRKVPQKQTTVLISCVSVTVTRGGGDQKIRKFADVISPLRDKLSEKMKHCTQ